MDFSNFVNVGLVMAIITIIETVKQILMTKKIELSANVWKLIVLGAGFPFGFLVSAIDGFNLFDAIVKGFIYSAAASLLYQVGKLGLVNLTKKE
jgi:hypothetical protein